MYVWKAVTRICDDGRTMYLFVDALFGLFAWVLVSLFATVGLTTTRK